MLSRSELKQIWFDAPRVPVKQQQLSKIRHFKYGANKIDHQWYFYSLCKGTLKLMLLVTGLEKCQLTRGDFQYVSCIWNTIKRMGIMELPTSFLNFVFNVGFWNHFKSLSSSINNPATWKGALLAETQHCSRGHCKQPNMSEMLITHRFGSKFLKGLDNSFLRMTSG